MNHTNVKISDKEAVGIVRKFITENNEGVGFVVTRTDYNKERDFWIISGEIKYGVDEETLKLDILSAIDNYLSSEDTGGIKRLQVAEKTKKLEDSLKKVLNNFNFCFYVNSYGKVCAISPHERFPSFVERRIDYIKSNEKDVNDIYKKAKEILEEGTTFKYVDYFPTTVLRFNEKWIMLMIVIYYARFDVFPKFYQCEFSSEGNMLFLKGYDAKKTAE